MKKYFNMILCAAAVMLGVNSCDYDDAAVKGTCEYTVKVTCVSSNTNGGEAIMAIDKKIDDEMMKFGRSWTAKWGGKTEEDGLKKADIANTTLFALDVTAIKNVVEKLQEELKAGNYGENAALSRRYEVVLMRDGKELAGTKQYFDFSFPAN